MPEQRLEMVDMPAGWRREVDLYLAGAGQGFNAHNELRHRLPEIARLYALDDTELFLLGIMRQDIPAFAFADITGEPRHKAWY